MSTSDEKGKKPFFIDVSTSPYPVQPSAPYSPHINPSVRNNESTVTFNLPETPPVPSTDAIQGDNGNPPPYNQLPPPLHNFVFPPSSSQINTPTSPTLSNFSLKFGANGFTYPYYPRRMIGAVQVMGTCSIICFFIVFLFVTSTIAYGSYLIFNHTSNFNNQKQPSVIWDEKYSF